MNCSENLNIVTPKVSIIITVYNHEHFIGEAIESVLSQTYENYELIIIDDGSTDNTIKVLERYKNHPKILIKSISHSGRPKALNVGFRLSKGDYITFLDSDDLYLPDKIKIQVDYLDKHASIVLVGTYAIEYDLVNDSHYTNKPPLIDKEIRKLLLYEAVMPFPTVMTRRKVLDKVGFCDEDIPIKVDFNLFGKIAQTGKLAVIPYELVIIRRHIKNSFRSLDPELHRKCMLKVRWLNLWRLKPSFLLFVRVMGWLCFEYFINLFPESFRHRFPETFRYFFKTYLRIR